MESAGTQAFLRFCDSVTSLGLFRVKRKKEKTIWSKKIKMVSGNWDLVPPLPVTCFIILVYSPGPSVFCLFVCCCCLFDWFAFVNMKWGQFTLLRKGNIDLNSCMYYTYIITCIFLYEYVYNLIQTSHFRGLNTLVGLKLTLIDCKINNDNTLYGSSE